MMIFSFWPLFAAGLLTLCHPVTARAGEWLEQDRARAALRAGQAMPYDVLRERVQAECACQILEAKLHPDKIDGRPVLIYDIKALRRDGQVLKLELDAASGEVLRMKAKGRKN